MRNTYAAGYAMYDAQSGSWFQAKSVVRVTGRQWEFLRYYATGVTQQSIARMMVISPKTVSAFASQCKEKFGCETERELFLVALDLFSKRGRRRSSNQGIKHPRPEAGPGAAPTDAFFPHRNRS